MSVGATQRTTRTSTKRTQRARKSMLKGAGANSLKAGLLVVLLAIVALGAVVLFMDFNHKAKEKSFKHKQALLQQELNARIKLVVAKSHLRQGSKVSANKLALKEFPKNTQVMGSFNTLSNPNLIGKYLTADVPAGQLILSNNLNKAKAPKKLKVQANEQEVKLPLHSKDVDLYFLKRGKSTSLYSVMHTASGNQINKHITPKARILLIEKNNNFLPKINTKNQGFDAMSSASKSYIYVAVDQDSATKLNKALVNRQSVRFLPPNEKPPINTASIIQIWNGTDMEEKEIVHTIGTTIADTEFTSNMSN